MLINRRQALLSLSLSACSGVMWSLQKTIEQPPSDEMHPASGGRETPLDNSDDRLRESLASIAPRISSEEGIPVFLACMNLVPARTSHPAKVILPPLSAALASSFHRNAEALRRIRPDASAQDIAPLIEVLAERDFSIGNTTEAL